MKALLINGSPHEHGCTYTALCEVASALEENGVEAEIYHIGTKPIAGCIACGSCRKTGKCVFDDGVNDIAARLDEFDALIVGSPVYYSGPSGQLCCFLDRLFFSSSRKLSGKPGAAVVSCRRGGASAAFDRLNKYFTINNMPVVSVLEPGPRHDSGRGASGRGGPSDNAYAGQKHGLAAEKP